MRKLFALWLLLMYGTFAQGAHFQVQNYRKGPIGRIHDALHTKYKYAEGYLSQIDVMKVEGHVITRLMLVDVNEPLLQHKVVLCGDDHAKGFRDFYGEKMVFATDFKSPYKSVVCSDFVAFLEEK